MRLTKSDILSLPGVRITFIEQFPKKGIRGISTDSRGVREGDLFVAIRGAHHDGHDFVAQAKAAGAAAAMVDSRWASLHEQEKEFQQFPLIVVNDTVLNLGNLAAIYRAKFNIPIIAITGSSGKTTVKDLVAAVLAKKFNVLKTEGNLNNFIGLPLTLFRLDSSHDVAVLELGTNHFGEIARLTEIANPTHGLVTNVGSAHLEFFKSLEGVANAKGELFETMSDHGTAFLNADDSYVRAFAPSFSKRILYGLKARNADVRGKILEFRDDGTTRIRILNRNTRGAMEISLQLVGEHNAMNALAAAAVGFAFKVHPAKIRHALESFSPLDDKTSGVRPGRMEILRISGVTIINDSYNANPDSVRAALRTLAAMKSSGKKIVVLGDMLELGEASEYEHAKLGVEIANLGFEYVLTFGQQMRFASEASKAIYAFHYDESAKGVLAEYLTELTHPGDIVLVKGSRGMKMEDVVAFLVERLRARSSRRTNEVQ